MKCRPVCLCLLAALPLLGCAPQYRTAADVAKATKVSRDPYSKTVWVNGPDIPYTQYGCSGSYFLRSLATRGGLNAIQLYVTYYSNQWAFLESAISHDGTTLTTRGVDREVYGAGSIKEQVVVELPRSYLDAAADDTGLDIRVSGKRDSVIAKVEPHYIRGFLDKVDDPATAATP